MNGMEGMILMSRRYIYSPPWGGSDNDNIAVGQDVTVNNIPGADIGLAFDFVTKKELGLVLKSDIIPAPKCYEWVGREEKE